MNGVQHISVARASRSVGIAEPAGRPVTRKAAGPKRAESAGMLLRQTIEDAIVPHLLNLHADVAQPDHVAPDRPDRYSPERYLPSRPAFDANAAAVAAAIAATDGRDGRLVTMINGLLDGGIAAERLYLDVLAPAARHLGLMWADDTLDLVSVTIGVMQLERALGLVRPPMILPAEPVTPSILMLPVPGNQHSFGLTMANDMFRRAGWSVTTGTPPGLEALGGTVRARAFDAIGFSVSCETQLDMLTQALATVRRCSRNPHVLTVVGGPMFLDDSGLASGFDADLVACDGVEAPQLLRSLWRRCRGYLE